MHIGAVRPQQTLPRGLCPPTRPYYLAMGQSEPGPPGRSSDILDAILDKVAGDKTRTDTSQALFRARALEQLDVAADIDNQLRLVPRRSWLLLLGATCIVVAFVLWAALTPSTQTVAAQGRVVATSGLIAVTAPATGTLEALEITAGARVAPATVVGSVRADGLAVPVRVIAGGTGWQVLRMIGSPTVAGQTLATLLPEDSGGSALLVLPEADASAVRAGMRVADDGGVIGQVTRVEPPLPAAAAEGRTGVAVDATSVVIVEVALTSPHAPGTLLSTTVLLTDGSVLQGLLGR